jgi:ankyrin repeat protein
MHTTTRILTTVITLCTCTALLPFIMAHAHLDAQNSSGTTALAFAAQQGNDKIVDMLLTAGANPMLRNHEVRTHFSDNFARQQRGVKRKNLS